MSVEVTQADREAAAPFVAQGMQSYSARSEFLGEVLRGDHDNHPHVQAFARHRIEAERAAPERAAVALEADGKLCDCHAFEEGECCCGAWDDNKTVTLERAAEIVRSLIGDGNGTT